MTDPPPPTPRARLHGVLVTFGRPAILQGTLRRLSAQTRPLDRLVVVDNGSDPAVRDLVADEGHALYLDPGDNVGPAGGFAAGMAQLVDDAHDDDWIFLLDDDDPPFFDDALEHAAEFGERMIALDKVVGAVGISGGRFDDRTGRVHRVGPADLHGAVPVNHIAGGGLPAYRVAAVRDVGPPLAGLFFGFEELEYGLRLSDRGYRLYADGEQWRRRREVKQEQGLLPSDEVLADRGKPSMRVSEPSWRRYYSLRNLILILRARGRSGTALRLSLTRGMLKPVANLVVSPRTARENLTLNWMALRDGWRGRMGRLVEPR